MKAQQFFKGLFSLLLLNLLIKPLWIFVIDRRVQNIVGREVYGTYFALFNLSYVLLFIADAGLTNMLTQRLAAAEELNVRWLVKCKLVLLLLYASVCVAVSFFTGIAQWKMIGLLILLQSLSSLLVFLRSLLTAKQAFKTDAVFSVLDKSLLLLLCIGPVYGFFLPMTITLFLQLQVISTGLVVASLLTVLLKRKAFTGGERIALKTAAAWVSPFVLIVLLMSAHNRLDAFLLERIHPNGAVEAGVYAMAYRLLDASNMVGYLTASFLVPFLTRNRLDKALVHQVVLASRHTLLFFAAGFVAFVCAFTPWLQGLLYHTTDAYTSTIIRLCIAALPAYYFIHVYGSTLTATAQFRVFILLGLFFVVLNTGLNLFLIPVYGAKGCCLAALATQYGFALTLWAAASRKLQIEAAVTSSLLYPATALAVAFLFLLLQKLTGNVWIILSSIVLLALVLLATQRRYLTKLFFDFYK